MRAQRLRDGVEYHAWQDHQDLTIRTGDGHLGYYLERPVTAGRLSSQWNYRLLLGSPHEQQTLITICKEYEKTKGVACQVLNLYGHNRELVASLHWYGDAKQRMTGKPSGTKKYMFDWQGRELVWDSKDTFTGVDHFCADVGSGEILCYFRSTFLPLKKEGKIMITKRIKDETSRTTLLASCIAYREWAAKRETGLYLS